MGAHGAIGVFYGAALELAVRPRLGRISALTATLAKVGIEDVNSDFATLVRTIVILAAAGAIVPITDHWQSPATVSVPDLELPGAEGWPPASAAVCYFRALKIGNAGQVAPIDTVDVVMIAIIAAVFLGEDVAVNWIDVALIGIGAILVAVQA